MIALLPLLKRHVHSIAVVDPPRRPSPLPHVTVDGKEFLILLNSGRIPLEYKELYEYVKSGKAPEAWVKGFEECNLLSEAKVEEARQAIY